MAGDPNWTDYTVQSQVTIHDDRQGQVGLAGRLQSTHFHYELLLGRGTGGGAQLVPAPAPAPWLDHPGLGPVRLPAGHAADRAPGLPGQAARGVGLARRRPVVRQPGRRRGHRSDHGFGPHRPGQLRRRRHLRRRPGDRRSRAGGGHRGRPGQPLGTHRAVARRHQRVPHRQAGGRVVRGAHPRHPAAARRAGHRLGLRPGGAVQLHRRHQQQPQRHQLGAGSGGAEPAHAVHPAHQRAGPGPGQRRHLLRRPQHDLRRPGVLLGRLPPPGRIPVQQRAGAELRPHLQLRHRQLHPHQRGDERRHHPASGREVVPHQPPDARRAGADLRGLHLQQRRHRRPQEPVAGAVRPGRLGPEPRRRSLDGADPACRVPVRRRDHPHPRLHQPAAAAEAPARGQRRWPGPQRGPDGRPGQGVPVQPRAGTDRGPAPAGQAQRHDPQRFGHREGRRGPAACSCTTAG